MVIKYRRCWSGDQQPRCKCIGKWSCLRLGAKSWLHFAPIGNVGVAIELLIKMKPSLTAPFEGPVPTTLFRLVDISSGWHCLARWTSWIEASYNCFITTKSWLSHHQWRADCLNPYQGPDYSTHPRATHWTWSLYPLDLITPPTGTDHSTHPRTWLLHPHWNLITLPTAREYYNGAKICCQSA